MFPPKAMQGKLVARAKPPMKVRGNLEASIDGLTLVPVFSYLPPSPHDDVNQKGCYYVDQCVQNQITDPKFYIAEAQTVLPIVGYRLAKAYGWAESKVASMNYLDFYLLADAIVAEKFEGSPGRAAFTEEDWYYIRNA